MCDFFSVFGKSLVGELQIYFMSSVIMSNFKLSQALCLPGNHIIVTDIFYSVLICFIIIRQSFGGFGFLSINQTLTKPKQFVFQLVFSVLWQSINKHSICTHSEGSAESCLIHVKPTVIILSTFKMRGHSWLTEKASDSCGSCKVIISVMIFLETSDSSLGLPFITSSYLREFFKWILADVLEIIKRILNC